MIAVQWWCKSGNGANKVFIYFPSPKVIYHILHHFLFDMHIRSIWWLSNENKRSSLHMFWIDPTSIRYFENTALKLFQRLTVEIVIFGSHKVMQELWRDLCEDSWLLYIVNNCHKESCLRYWQDFWLRLWHWINSSFRCRAKFYHILRTI